MLDRVAVVTGGSSGLGFAIATLLGAEGIGVSILARDPARLGDAVDRLRAADGDAHGVACDISKEEEVRSAFDEITQRGTIQFLFNVAGAGRFGAVEDVTEKMIQEVLAGNLTGLMISTAIALPILRGAGGGMIVSVLSSAALVGRPQESVYCAAKWGARGFMEALRVALKDSTVRTLTVYPGGMRTPFWSVASEQSPDLSTYMEPTDVAKQILRVALDPGSAHVTEMTISRGS
jgi:NAD(P)-dependent dehydrogenase (short-subunit alcohol dehydrogenase family)